MAKLIDSLLESKGGARGVVKSIGEVKFFSVTLAAPFAATAGLTNTQFDMGDWILSKNINVVGVKFDCDIQTSGGVFKDIPTLWKVDFSLNGNANTPFKTIPGMTYNDGADNLTVIPTMGSQNNLGQWCEWNLDFLVNSQISLFTSLVFAPSVLGDIFRPYITFAYKEIPF